MADAVQQPPSTTTTSPFLCRENLGDCRYVFRLPGCGDEACNLLFFVPLLDQMDPDLLIGDQLHSLGFRIFITKDVRGLSE